MPGVFKPNCEFVVEKEKNVNKVYIHALVNIDPGTELFVEYGASYFRGLKIKPMTKAELEKKFLEVYKAGRLGTNLRDNGADRPELSKWVKMAHNIIKERRRLKSEKQAELDKKKKRQKQEPILVHWK